MTDPQVIVNLGTGGSDLNGQNGSTSSADSNDARFLDWPGDNAGNYVYVPNVAGNYVSVPDAAALDITGDLDVRVHLAMDDWSSTTDSLVSKFLTTGDQRSWLFMKTASRFLRVIYSTDGVSQPSATSTAGFTEPSDDLWVRFTLDADNGAGGADWKFYTSTDGSSWTQLGATVTTASTVSLYSSSSDIVLGGYNNGAGSLIATKYYRAQILDGIDGTTVLDVDTSVITSGSTTSFTDITGNHTATINRSTSGRKSVAVVSPVWLFGTDDFIRVFDNAQIDFDATDDFTIVMAIRRWNTTPSQARYISKEDVSGGRYTLFSGGSQQIALFIRDGTTQLNNVDVATTAGTLGIVIATVDRSLQTGSISGYGDNDSGVISAIGSLENDKNLAIGAFSQGGSAQDFELIAVAIFGRILTTDEQQSVTSFYESRLS